MYDGTLKDDSWYALHPPLNPPVEEYLSRRLSKGEAGPEGPWAWGGGVGEDFEIISAQNTPKAKPIYSSFTQAGTGYHMQIPVLINSMLLIKLDVEGLMVLCSE